MGWGSVRHGIPRGVSQQDLGQTRRAQLDEGVEEQREDVRRVEQVGAHHQVEGARGAHALQVRFVAPQQLRRHLHGQEAVKWAALEAASSSTRGSGWAPSGPARPESAELPRAARRALRRHRSRAGALPGGGDSDHAAPPPSRRRRGGRRPR